MKRNVSSNVSETVVGGRPEGRPGLKATNNEKIIEGWFVPGLKPTNLPQIIFYKMNLDFANQSLVVSGQIQPLIGKEFILCCW